MSLFKRVDGTAKVTTPTRRAKADAAAVGHTFLHDVVVNLESGLRRPLNIKFEAYAPDHKHCVEMYCLSKSLEFIISGRAKVESRQKATTDKKQAPTLFTKWTMLRSHVRKYLMDSAVTRKGSSSKLDEAEVDDDDTEHDEAINGDEIAVPALGGRVMDAPTQYGSRLCAS